MGKGLVRWRSLWGMCSRTSGGVQAFLLHKHFHPANFRNLEKKYEVEQRHEEEQKRLGAPRGPDGERMPP